MKERVHDSAKQAKNAHELKLRSFTGISSFPHTINFHNKLFSGSLSLSTPSKRQDKGRQAEKGEWGERNCLFRIPELKHQYLHG